jgi:hypothetical protein
LNASEIIIEILKYLGMNSKAFSEKLGYERPQIIYDLRKGKTKIISVPLANKISSVFPEISKTWLLTGEGEMLKDSENLVKLPNSEYEKSPNRTEIVEFLMEQNRSLEKIVHDQNKIMIDQNEVIKTHLQRITELEAEIRRSKNESNVQGEDAKCAAVG